MSLLIGNLDSNQLYEILNVLCQYKIIIRGNKKAGWSCKICTECTVPEPLYDISKLDEKRAELVDELSSKKKESMIVKKQHGVIISSIIALLLHLSVKFLSTHFFISLNQEK